MVYFWSIAKLSEDLKNKQVGSRDILSYFLLFIFVYLLDSNAFIPADLGYSFFLNWGLAVTVMIGVWLAWKMNNKGDGEAFIERFVSLSLPITIKLFVLKILVSLVMAVIFMSVRGADFLLSQKYLEIRVALNFFFLLIYFLWVRKCIRAVSKV